MSNAYRILPTRNGDLRSREFTVGPGEYAKLTGYELCPGLCLKINEVHMDRCRCIHDERPYCLNGSQIGLDAKCPQAIVPMPGVYVAYLCADEGVDISNEDFSIHLNICKDLSNVQTVIMAAGVQTQ